MKKTILTILSSLLLSGCVLPVKTEPTKPVVPGAYIARLRPVVVGDWADSEISTAMSDLPVAFDKYGISFDIQPSVIDRTEEWKTPRVENNLIVPAGLIADAAHRGAGGELAVYFVNTLQGGAYIGLANFPNGWGVLIAHGANLKTVPHELGHFFGLPHIMDAAKPSEVSTTDQNWMSYSGIIPGVFTDSQIDTVESVMENQRRIVMEKTPKTAPAKARTNLPTGIAVDPPMGMKDTTLNHKRVLRGSSGRCERPFDGKP